MISIRHLFAAILPVSLSLIACQTESVASQSAEGFQLDDAGTAELIEALDRAIETEMEENYIPGVGLVIVHQGRTIYARGYGVANVATGAPVDPERTIFRIGSVSKALTLLTLARQVDSGALERDTNVSAFAPPIENAPGFESPVTVENVLTHTTGFDQIGLDRQIDGFELPLPERLALRGTLTDFLAERNLRRVSAPGAYFRYDTYGPTLAGVILEELTGLSFPEAMKQEMFDPLGMARSFVEVEAGYLDDLASGHGYIDGTYARTPYEIYETTPASSIDATVADMGRLLEALTGDGSNAHGRFVSPQIAEAFRSPQYRPHPDFAGMTHGLWESFGQGRGAEAIPVYTLGHGGDMWGFNSSMTILPEFDLAFFVVANRNQEAGGPPVRIGRPVMETILATLVPDRRIEAAAIPERDPEADLSDYVGGYVWGVYCHSCSDAEFERRAWRQPRPIEIIADDGALRIRDNLYTPEGSDIFVREDGYDRIFFNRDTSGAITSYSHQEDPTVYERL